MSIGKSSTRKPRAKLPAAMIGLAFQFTTNKGEVPNVARMRDLLRQINSKPGEFNRAADLDQIDDKSLENRVDRFLKQYVASKTGYDTGDRTSDDQPIVMSGKQLAARLGVDIVEFATDYADKYDVAQEFPEPEFQWSNPTGRRGRAPFDPNAIDRQLAKAADLLDSLE